MAMVSLSKVTYPQRLFLWLLGYSLLLCGCFVLFQYNREKQFKAEEMNTRLQAINRYILTELDEGHKPSDIKLTEFHPFDDIRISVIDSSGKIVYDNSLDSLPNKSHLDREEIRAAIASGYGYTVRRHSESTGNTYFYSATKDKDGYIVRTAVPYSLPLSELLRADYTFLWVMGLVSLAMCILGYFATRRVGLHIIRLNKFADNVEKGIRISDTEPFPNDELGAISNNIVRLYARLQQAYTERDNQHRAALHEQQEKERIKKQLTNNINHELKTPIASIAICLETLLEHKDLTAEQREHFLKEGLKSTERLRQLITDVTLITRMDDGCTSLTKEDVNLADIIANVTEEYSFIAKAKGISIKCETPDELTMRGNPSLLAAIFSNLTNNAIAYSGGSLITISMVQCDDSKITLDFSDNGTGVPEEHLPRLFERFYRIDKGRSRSSGGTGLGLSIVKNAVSLHGGTIAVVNSRSGGLSFRFTLARNRQLSQ